MKVDHFGVMKCWSIDNSIQTHSITQQTTLFKHKQTSLFKHKQQVYSNTNHSFNTQSTTQQTTSLFKNHHVEFNYNRSFRAIYFLACARQLAVAVGGSKGARGIVGRRQAFKYGVGAL